MLIALYSVRSDRAFCESLDYNLLYRWFLDMGLEEPGLDQSNFSRLRERLVETDIARRFFDAVVRLARRSDLLMDEHFTVDSTLIEAWASMKSLRQKGGPPPRDGGDDTGSENIHIPVQRRIRRSPCPEAWGPTSDWGAGVQILRVAMPQAGGYAWHYL